MSNPVSEVWQTEMVERVVSDSIDEVLKDQIYSDDLTQFWGNKICEIILTRLVDLKKPSRYSIDCLIMQRNGAGLHSASAAYFDNTADGQISYLWPREKTKDQPNKTMICQVTVFGTTM